MSKHIFLRSEFDGPAVELSNKRFRKQLLRFGTWSHKAAPDGKLHVTRKFVDQIVANFNRGIRDDVPVPLGHDKDAISSIGQVVALEVDDEGLWGIHEIAKAEDADKIGSTWTGSSAFIEMDAEDKETGERLGPVLVHNAITNAPYIKDLAPFESIALGEGAGDAVVIALQDTNEGEAMTLEELLAEISETSDDELRVAIEKARPEMKFASADDSEDEPDEDALAQAKAEGAKELVAALAEKGVKVALSENDKDSEKDTKVDITSAPEFVSLSERVGTLEGEKVTTAVEAVIDKAIKEGKVLPAQRKGMVTVGLSEGGLDTLKELIPAEAIVDLNEEGFAPTTETNVELSEEDASKEADRLVAAYATTGKKGE